MTATFIQAGLMAPPSPTPIAEQTYFGWFDPDKRRSAVDKLANGIERYRESRGADPTVVLCNIVDANELRDADVDLDVRDVSFLGKRGTFYLGVS